MIGAWGGEEMQERISAGEQGGRKGVCSNVSLPQNWPPLREKYTNQVGKAMLSRQPTNLRPGQAAESRCCNQGLI